jgi:hypothetical protein
MTDFRMIKLDADDFEAIQFALSIAAKAAGDHRGSVAVDFTELADDIREQWHRNDDEWGWRDDPTDLGDSLVGSVYRVAEEDFISAGIVARERLKDVRKAQHDSQAYGEFEVSKTPGPSARPFADTDTRTASLAAKRRDERLMRGTASPCVAEFMNDPVDW